MSLSIDKYLRTWGWASVLIVDDSPFNLLILHEIFDKLVPKNQGKFAQLGKPRLIVDEAPNGLKAVEIVEKSISKDCCNGIELILMDLNMPVMDGASATTEIVKLQEKGLIHSGLKIVALTAYDSPEHKKLWAKAGMKGFLNKPVDISSIKRLFAS